jgi:glycosyltransferase involved in cell wall biosynthesis
MTTVACCIPSIPPRTKLLQRAITSVLAQTRPVDEIHVVIDHGRQGAAATRTRACQAASADWLALLDDDDQFYPQHVERLLACAQETGADLVWPWFDVEGGTDPFPPAFFGRQWHPAEPHQFPITVLVRREALEAVGWFLITAEDGVRMPGWTGEDMLCWVRLSLAGFKLVHLPERTWRWHHDSSNTQGLPDRW